MISVCGPRLVQTPTVVKIRNTCLRNGSEATCRAVDVSAHWDRGGGAGMPPLEQSPWPARFSFYDPVSLGALAARSWRRIRVTVVQRPQHGDVGHHNNAALFGGRDQKFHCDLPMLALGFGRRERKNINASIA
jgi:hypothetical protein